MQRLTWAIFLFAVTVWAQSYTGSIRGTITGANALNESFAASAIPDPTLVPHLFYGGYVQAAYTDGDALTGLHIEAALRVARARDLQRRAGVAVGGGEQ